MNLEQLCDRVHARRSGANWIARCPAHEDKNPSLSVSQEGDKLLLHCHAGCTVEDICASLQIKSSDLFISNGNGNGNGSAPRIVATYQYVDESGKLLYENVRYEPKNFRQRRPDGDGWTWNLGNVRRVPYRLPQILAANNVLIVEGEKDVHAAESLGAVATSSKNWRPEYIDHFRGKRIAIIADGDEPGKKIAADVAQMLAGHVACLKVVELPGSKDLTDWVNAGGTAEVLSLFIKEQPEWKSEPTDWRNIFDSFEDFENAPPLSYVVENFLQKDGATGIAGLAGHGKTWILLSIAEAILAGPPKKLWSNFNVLERVERVVYLIPECGRSAFKHRLKLMGLYDHVQSGRLIVRTLSKGPAPDLGDARILFAAKDSVVMLDTAIRWVRGDESSASDNQTGLASDVFRLLEAGALAVLPAYHSPKSFGGQTVMNLENALRGSGDLGAMLATCWAIKQLDKATNLIHVENVKARDFQACGPFQLIGRPSIDDTGDFAMHKSPGECGSLQDEQPERDKGGAPIDAREIKAAKVELLKRFLEENPQATSKQLAQRFEASGMKVSEIWVRKNWGKRD